MLSHLRPQTSPLFAAATCLRVSHYRLFALHGWESRIAIHSSDDLPQA